MEMKMKIRLNHVMHCINTFGTEANLQPNPTQPNLSTNQVDLIWYDLTPINLI